MRKYLRLIFIAFTCILFFQISEAQTYGSEDEMKKQAQKFFSEEKYFEATPLYSQLLSVYSKDPLYNYRYGVCIVNTARVKTSAIQFLEFASRQKKTESNVWFWLGKAYHLNYQFSEAINAFTQFKKSGSNSEIKKFETDRQIESCNNALQLMKQRQSIDVVNKQQVAKNSFSSVYNFDNVSGKILSTPEKFLTSEDKEKTANPLMFLSKDNNTIYYSSFGKKGNHAKDIFIIHKLADGTWGEPQNPGSAINTDYNEDYPYLDKDGHTLYFSSCGHNSMGGYDIFRTVYNPANQSWSDPENLGIPVNSPDDDFFYVPESSGKFAYYATARESEKGMVEVYKISTSSEHEHLVEINGKYFSKDQQLRRDATVSVIRKSDNAFVASAHTDARTGAYQLAVPMGDEYLLVVEGGSYAAHSENLSVPKMNELLSIRQEVALNKTKEGEDMTVKNIYVTGTIDSSIETSPIVSVNHYFNDEEKNSAALPLNIDGKIINVSPPAVLQNDTAAAAINNQEQNKTVAVATENKSADEKISSNENKNEVVKNETDTTSVSKYSTEENKTTVASNENKIADEKVSESGNKNVLVKKDNDTASVIKNNIEENKTAVASIENKSEEGKNSSERNNKSIDKNESDSVVALNKTTSEKQNSTEQELTVESKKNAPENKTETKTEDKNNTVKKNISEKKSVKMAFDEAHSLEAEAKKTFHDAEFSKTQAEQKDSLSKVQLQEMKPLILSANPRDRERAKVLAKQSEENAKQSEKANAMSKELFDQANKKQTEADQALSEAKNLMQQTIGDTATLASNAQSNNNNLKNENKKPDENVSENVSAENKNPEVNASNISSKKNNPARKQSEELQLQSEELAMQAQEATDKANATDDKKEKKQFIKQSKELKQQSTAKQKEAEKILAEEKMQEADTDKNINAVNKQTSENQKSETDSLPAPDSSAKNIVPENNSQKTTTENSDSISSQPTVRMSSTLHQSVEVSTSVKQQAAENLPAEVKTAYQNYKTLQLSSDSIAEEGKKASDDAAKANDKITQDKLTQQSNELGMLSVKKWQEAQQELNKAKQVEPQVVQIMTDAESERNERAGSNNSKQIEKDNSATQNISESENLTKQTRASKNEVQSEIKNIQPVVSNSSNDEGLNKADPKYKEYVSLNKQAETKQNQSVVSFAQGLKFDRQSDSIASVAKQHEDKSTNATDAATKENENALAGKYYKQATDLKKLAADKFALTKTNLEESRVIIKKSNTLRQQLTVSTSVENPVATENKISASESNQNENNSVEQNKTENKNPDQENSNVNSKTDLAVEKKSADQSSNISSEKSKAEEKSNGSTESKNVVPANSITDDAATIFSRSTSSPAAASLIPIDVALPEGLVFKVQIAAFKKPVESGRFGNISPVTGETTRSGWIRYLAGFFRVFETANALKKELHTKGFQDAFVVAYNNGKRIELFEAYQLMKDLPADQKQLYENAKQTETVALKKENISDNNFDSKSDNDANKYFGRTTEENSGEIRYSVQVGVYKRSTPPRVLTALQPLEAEPMAKGLFRFTYGIYDSRMLAETARKEAVSAGVPDAFIIKYRGGQKIISNSVTEGKNKVVVNPSTNAESKTARDTVTEAEKISSQISFRVQVGAFKNAVPAQIISMFSFISSKGLYSRTDERGLHLYFAGKPSSYEDAVTIKNDVIAKGISGAFLVAYDGAKKIPVLEALQASGKR